MSLDDPFETSLSRTISCDNASDVSGPLAMTVTGSRSISATSSRRTVISGSFEIASVTFSAKAMRSTASACPAGTAHSRAISISSEPALRSSSFSSQGAVFTVSDFREFEQTSSAKSLVRCAGVDRNGRISKSSTAMPRRAHCHAASEPASPAPTILMLGMLTFTTGNRFDGMNQSFQLLGFIRSEFIAGERPDIFKRHPKVGPVIGQA